MMYPILQFTEHDWQIAVDRDPRTLSDENLIKAWPITQRAISQRSAAELIDRSEYGLDGQPGADAELSAIDIRSDGTVMLEINIYGNVEVPLSSIVASGLELGEIDELLRASETARRVAMASERDAEAWG